MVVAPPQERIRDTEETGRFKQWQLQSVLLRGQMQVSAQYSPWTAAPERKCLGIPHGAQRVRDLLDCAWASRVKGLASHAAAGFWCNISQSHEWKPWGSLGTLCSSCELFSFELDSMVPDELYWVLQGYPVPALRHESLNSKMPGQSFFVPSVTVILAAFYLNPAALLVGRGRGHGQEPLR